MTPLPDRPTRRSFASAVFTLTAVGALVFAGLQAQPSAAAEAAVNIPPLADAPMAEAKGDWDAALEFYEEAVMWSPPMWNTRCPCGRPAFRLARST